MENKKCLKPPTVFFFLVLDTKWGNDPKDPIHIHNNYEQSSHFPMPCEVPESHHNHSQLLLITNHY